MQGERTLFASTKSDACQLGSQDGGYAFYSTEEHSTDHECASDNDFMRIGADQTNHQQHKIQSQSCDYEELSHCNNISQAMSLDDSEESISNADQQQSSNGSKGAGTQSLLRGFFFMNNFCLLNNCAAMSFKFLLQEGVSVFVLALFRNVVLLLISLLAAFYSRKGPFQPTTENSSYQQPDSQQYSKIPLKIFDVRFLQAQARSLFGTLSFLLFTVNLQLLPMTFIIIIFQTNPLWSAILGFLINRERVSRLEFIAMLASFTCVIFIAIARSTQSASESDSAELTQPEEDAAVADSSQNGLWLGVFLCLCHAWLFSGIGVLSRRLQRVHFSELMIHQSAQGVILVSFILAGFALFGGRNLVAELTGKQALILLGGCASDSLAMISMCIGFQAVSTSLASMVGYMAIVYAIITDLCVFGDSLSKAELIGCAAIISITLFVGIMRSRAQQALERQASQKELARKAAVDSFCQGMNDEELCNLSSVTDNVHDEQKIQGRKRFLSSCTLETPSFGCELTTSRTPMLLY